MIAEVKEVMIPSNAGEVEARPIEKMDKEISKRKKSWLIFSA